MEESRGDFTGLWWVVPEGATHGVASTSSVQIPTPRTTSVTVYDGADAP